MSLCYVVNCQDGFRGKLNSRFKAYLVVVMLHSVEVVVYPMIVML